MAGKSKQSSRGRPQGKELRFPVVTSSGSCLTVLTGNGSGSHGRARRRCKFLPKNQPVPVALNLRVDAPITGGPSVVRKRLNQPAQLVHAHDAFVCCWFSRAIDFADESGNPAFWMLERTAVDRWSLRLRRVSGEVAAYNLKTKSTAFPVQLKKGKVSKEFKWPPTITIRQDG